ncbi:MAG: adenosylcobinamide-GDP ribazoletransferase [Myxococcota bacterium]|nr:adenosylcobinamide-GDP ribazoletransferase [Myxococcota bacterium]
MPAWLLAFRASFTFLTRIPVGGFPYPPATWRWITLWFPLVGLILGAGQWLTWELLEGLSDWTRCIVVVMVGVMITGAFHEDGLSDSVDGLGGGYDPETVLRIIKDSRVGAFGSLALFFVLLLKISLLVDLGASVAWGFVLGQSLSRVVPVVQLAMIPYANAEDPKSKSRDVARSGQVQAFVAALWGLGILSCAVLLGLEGSAAIKMVGAMLAVGVVWSWYVIRRVGGLAGDFLGATQQFSELAVLLVLATA